MRYAVDGGADGRRICSFEPVADENSRLLILGTMPSVKSLEESFYYAHPRNAFWPMISEILNEPLPHTAEEKKEMLIKHHIALWDVAKSCVREGSLDSSMKDVELNDFRAFFDKYPRIERVLLNGGTAWELYHRLPEEIVRSRPCAKLPSTSPAYTLKYERKLSIWREEINRGLV